MYSRHYSLQYIQKYIFTLISNLIISEEGIVRDADCIEEGIRNADVLGVISKVTSIGKRTTRVSQVAEQEANKTEDSKFMDRVKVSTTQLNESKWYQEVREENGMT